MNPNVPKVCRVCDHLEVNCTGGGLESEDQAHDFQPSIVEPETCWNCGEFLDPKSHVIYWADDWCDAGHYCDDSCRDNHLAQIAAEAVDAAEGDR